VRDLYDAVAQKLAMVNFEEIWAGFVPFKFALFDHENVWLADKTIPWDARFLGNTAIDFEGEPLAIWQVANKANNDNGGDADALAAGLAHEMFHAFQMQQGDRRHGDELTFLRYPVEDEDNGNLKMAEAHYLSKAFAEGAHEDLAQFAALRNARRRIVGKEIFAQEMLMETKEGMAEYAGLMALNQLNRSKFVEDVGRHMQALKNPKMLTKPRLWAYSSGVMLCLALKALRINFHHHLSDTRPLFDFVPQQESGVKSAIAEHKSDLQKEFAKFLDGKVKTAVNAAMTGFDPMNMTRLGDDVLCARFVMLGGIYMQGPIMLHMAENSPNRVIAYTK